MVADDRRNQARALPVFTSAHIRRLRATLNECRYQRCIFCRISGPPAPAISDNDSDSEGEGEGEGEGESGRQKSGWMLLLTDGLPIELDQVEPITGRYCSSPLTLYSIC